MCIQKHACVQVVDRCSTCRKLLSFPLADAAKPPTPSSAHGCVSPPAHVKIHPPPLSAQRLAKRAHKKEDSDDDDDSDSDDDSDDSDDDDHHDKKTQPKLKFALQKSSKTGQVREGYAVRVNTKSKSNKPHSDDDDTDDDTDADSDDDDSDDESDKKKSKKSSIAIKNKVSILNH